MTVLWLSNKHGEEFPNEAFYSCMLLQGKVSLPCVGTDFQPLTHSGSLPEAQTCPNLCHHLPNGVSSIVVTNSLFQTASIYPYRRLRMLISELIFLNVFSPARRLKSRLSRHEVRLRGLVPASPTGYATWH